MQLGIVLRNAARARELVAAYEEAGLTRLIRGLRYEAAGPYTRAVEALADL